MDRGGKPDHNMSSILLWITQEPAETGDSRWLSESDQAVYAGREGQSVAAASAS